MADFFSMRGAELSRLILFSLVPEITRHCRRDTVDQIAEEGEMGILVEPPRDAGGSVGYSAMLRDPDGRPVEFTNGQPIEGLY